MKISCCQQFVTRHPSTCQENMDMKMIPKVEDFKFLKPISRGAFGKVFLGCKKEKPNELYAIKVVKKSVIVTKNLMEQMITERDAQARIRSPFCVPLFYSLQTKENVYLIMEYMIGGDLKSLLTIYGYFEEPMALFYIAELSVALDYLHRLGIIHRDVKPDNLLLDAQGHLKLTDFGLSQFTLIQDFKIGTPGIGSRFLRTPGQILSLNTHLFFTDSDAGSSTTIHLSETKASSESQIVAAKDTKVTWHTPRTGNYNILSSTTSSSTFTPGLRHQGAATSPVVKESKTPDHRECLPMGTPKYTLDFDNMDIPESPMEELNWSSSSPTGKTVSLSCSQSRSQSDNDLHSSLVVEDSLQRVTCAFKLSDSHLNGSNVGIHSLEHSSNDCGLILSSYDGALTGNTVCQLDLHSKHHLSEDGELNKNEGCRKCHSLPSFGENKQELMNGFCNCDDDFNDVIDNSHCINPLTRKRSICDVARSPTFLNKKQSTQLTGKFDQVCIATSKNINDEVQDSSTSFQCQDMFMVKYPQGEKEEASMDIPIRILPTSVVHPSYRNLNKLISPQRNVKLEQRTSAEDSEEVGIQTPSCNKQYHLFFQEALTTTQCLEKNNLHTPLRSESSIQVSSQRDGELQTPLRAPKSVRRGIIPATSCESRILGTPDYLAPELLLKLEHGPEVDWWAVGVCSFEFMTGMPPFNDITPESVFDHILNRDIPWPEGEEALSDSAVEVIDHLLTFDPKGRPNLSTLKSLSFFDDINWLKLRDSVSPFTPQPDNAMDTTYFNARNNLQELIVSGVDL